MGQSLLATDGGDALGLPVQIHAKTLFIKTADGPQQGRNTPGGGIAMCFVVLDDLNQLVDDVLGGGLVGVAHTQVDDIGSLLAQTKFDVIELPKQIGRQALQPLRVNAGHEAHSTVFRCRAVVLSCCRAFLFSFRHLAPL